MKLERTFIVLAAAIVCLSWSNSGTLGYAVPAPVAPNYAVPTPVNPGIAERGFGIAPVKAPKGGSRGGGGGGSGSIPDPPGGLVGPGLGPVIGGVPGSGVSNLDKTIGDWGLIRAAREDPNPPPVYTSFEAGGGTGFKAQGDWQPFTIRRGTEEPTMEYTLNPSSGTFVTTWVRTTDDTGSRLGMARRDMIADSWTASGGDLQRLQVLGDDQIINEAVRRSIDDAFTANQRDPGYGGSLDLYPGASGWNEINRNAFVGGYQNMIIERGALMGHASISRIWVNIDSDSDIYEMFTFLAR